MVYDLYLDGEFYDTCATYQSAWECAEEKIKAGEALRREIVPRD